MTGKVNDRIAFNDLERMIIDPGFCTFCGACEAICPVHAIKVGKGKVVRNYDCAEHLDSCPICYEICPHTDFLLPKILHFVSDAPFWNESLGYYRSIVLAQSADTMMRRISKSGGVVMALLDYAINDKEIDSAIVSQTHTENPLEDRPSIINVPDDMLSAIDTNFIPSTVAQAFGRAVFEHGKSSIAFVGIPCHVMSLRKLEAFQHKFIDSLKITIGLFCLWAFSSESLLLFFSQEYGISSHDIKNVDLEEQNYVITTASSEIKIPFSKLMPHIMNRCRTCGHFTSQVADLSIGGATPLKDWSIVIIRTKAGEELFDAAVAKGVITVKDIHSEPKSMARLEKIAMYKRENALKEINALKSAGQPIPPGYRFMFTKEGKSQSRV
jgi:coenzyme F420 hydrogenase subunit beta